MTIKPRMVLQSEDFRKFPIFDAFLKPHFDVGHMGRGQGTGDREPISSKPPQLGTGDGRIERNGTVGDKAAPAGMKWHGRTTCLENYDTSVSFFAICLFDKGAMILTVIQPCIFI